MSNEKFTKADLKVGYVVKLRDGHVCVVTELDDGRLILIEDKAARWCCVESGTSGYRSVYTDDLLYYDRRDEGFDVMEVYGYARYSHYCLYVSTEERPLLWKREEKTCDSCAHKVVCTHVGMCEHYMEVAGK